VLAFVKRKENAMTTQRLTRALALCAVIALAAGAQQGNYKPYQEKLSDGVVDWDEGWIRADASVPLRHDVPPAQARVEAQRVATVKAQAAALRIALRLPVDSEQRLEAFEALRVHVKGVVAGGRILSEGPQGRDYKLSLRVPINGVSGIVAEVSKVTLPPLEAEPLPPPAPSKPKAPPPVPPASSPGQTEKAQPGSSTVFSSVTVDGIEAGIKPALQPRIVDPQGVPVYSVKTVKRLVAREKTIARYVTPAEASGASPAAWLDPAALSSLPLALAGPPWRIFAQRAPSQRQRGEEGTLMVKAVSSAGPLKADIVVTEETARQLRAAEAASGILSDARVVVVVRADVGGVESRRLMLDSGSRELARR
jgi:hypothetical protein